MVYNLCKCNGITQAEASKYVNNDSKAYIPSTKMSVEEGLKLAKEAGALTILAHPCLLPKEYVLEIIDKGFEGFHRNILSKEHSAECDTDLLGV